MACPKCGPVRSATFMLILLALFISNSLAEVPLSLAERLGYRATDRLLIVNADDVGNAHEANAATIDGMTRGLITSGSIMVPCPWFSEVVNYARAHPEADFGLHLTHTSEWKRYRWSPVSDVAMVPGLVDSMGYLWPEIEDVYRHGTPEEAETEARAQIEMAIRAGIDITHIDSHMGTLQYNPNYHAPYLRLAIEFGLPMRVASQSILDQFGEPHRRGRIADAGIVFPDYLIHDLRMEDEPVDVYWKRILRSLEPGVTELYIHPAVGTTTMKRITNRWEDRAEEHRLFTDDPEVRKIIEEEAITLIGWRELRDLQRQESGDSAVGGQ
jgi:predicted glycoside hydrolase/deacetylase ChbG (UPF0249 family)